MAPAFLRCRRNHHIVCFGAVEVNKLDHRMNNVLILAAGRRVELVQAFQADLASRVSEARVFAADLQPALSSACQVADRAFVLPHASDPAYPDALLRLSRDNGVGLVVPTIDTELLMLAFERDRFAAEGVHLVISDSTLVSDCRDKRRTAALFEEIGINTPAIYPRDAVRFPAFAKPYDGSRSIGALALPSAEALTPALLADEKLMFMEFIGSDHDEFTVDAYYDRGGALRCVVPRQRLEVRSGEVSKGVTRRGDLYDYLLPRLSRIQGARGCLTIQLFVHRDTGACVGIEINPRFGGGFPLTHAAGGAYPGWLIDEYLLDRPVAFHEDWKPALVMLRYDAKVLVDDPGV
jgi:carbamoyl-phosphate synthase large subunit